MLLSRSTSHSNIGYSPAGPSRVGVIGTIAVHALLVGGYLLVPAEVMEHYIPTITIGKNVPLTPPPPENPVVEKADPKPLPKSSPLPYAPRPAVDLDTSAETITPGTIIAKIDPVIIEPLGTDIIEQPRDPIFTAVSIDPRYARDFQPDYPPAMQRAQEEGKVTVRVIIGSDGRVTAVEKIFATTEAFWEAAKAQALRKWRFRAATRDGVPVTSEKVMTVHFQLN